MENSNHRKGYEDDGNRNALNIFQAMRAMAGSHR